MISKEKLLACIEENQYMDDYGNWHITPTDITDAIESGELDADETETQAELTQARAEIERLKDRLHEVMIGQGRCK